jgi:hypothetical protein
VIEAVRAEGMRRGTAEGMRRGTAEGMRRGTAEGMRRGTAEGMRRGTAEAVVAVLAARGVPLDDGQRDRILDEQDLVRLERWITRALACASAAELLAEP